MKWLALTLGVLGNVLSMMVLAVPMVTFWRIFKKKSTESFSAFPYVCTLLSNMLWLYYGILDPSEILLITISVAGCTLETFYLAIYMRYAPSREKATLAKQLAIIIFLYPCFVTITMKFLSGDERLRIVGLLCSFNSICMYASPLSVVGNVITSKSVEYMPFLLSFALFLCGGVWFGYAILMEDPYLEVSNGVGFLLGFTQLVVYALYYKSEPPFQSLSKSEDSTPSLDPNMSRSKLLKSKINNDLQSQLQRKILTLF